MARVSSRKRSLMAWTWSSMAFTTASTADKSVTLLAGYTATWTIQRLCGQLWLQELDEAVAGGGDGSGRVLPFRAMTRSWSSAIRRLNPEITESNDAPAVFTSISFSLYLSSETFNLSVGSENLEFFVFQFGETVLAGKCIPKSLKLLPTRYAQGPSFQAQFSSPPQFDNPTWAAKIEKSVVVFVTQIFLIYAGFFFFFLSNLCRNLVLA